MAQKALETDAYLCFEDLDRDVRMMCNNCVRYNGSMNEVNKHHRTPLDHYRKPFEHYRTPLDTAYN